MTQEGPARLSLLSEDPRPSSLEVSVVMPCLNEVRTLEECVLKAQRAIEEHGYAGEVIVSDNGSTDGSIELADRLGARVVHAQRKGYGAALQAGIEAAHGEFVVMGDCDGSYDFAHLDRFITELRKGHDLVMGNRFAGGIAPGAMPKLHRYFGNPVLSTIGRRIFGRRAGDFYCGLRGFRKDTYERLSIRSEGMEFALEMVSKMTMHGARVTEVPTTLSPDGRDRKPHLRTWRDGWRSLRLFLLLSPKWLFWYPGLLMMLVGFGLGARLVAGPLQIGDLSLDVHTLAACAAIGLIGFQSALFAALAKAKAVRSGLHPSSPKVDRLFRVLSIERGLLLGGSLVAIGAWGMFAAFFSWAGKSYGELDPFRTMRVVIPSLLGLAIGAQIVLASFFLSFTAFVEQSRGPRLGGPADSASE
ncbi:MAG: dolichol-P-glucose synthetase [Planctomycetes bacterium]|nr:dolichol-P-glucose synthetase [Planctomycetota bacterium]